jgi:hypothetical protein
VIGGPANCACGCRVSIDSKVLLCQTVTCVRATMAVQLLGTADSSHVRELSVCCVWSEGCMHAVSVITNRLWFCCPRPSADG